MLQILQKNLSGLVIDGSIAYPFNDGTKSLLEVLPEDALLTMRMKEWRLSKKKQKCFIRWLNEKRRW